MTKFKIGDRVRRIGQDNRGLSVGDTGTVLGLKTVCKEAQWLYLGYLEDDKGRDKAITYGQGGHSGKYFELVATEVSSDQSLSNGDIL